MKYVENGVPEDFARLTFDGLNVPLCELTEEEFMWIVFGVKEYNSKHRKRGVGSLLVNADEKPKHEEESIDVLELSVRAEHCLQRAGIKTIGQLCAMTELDLAKLRNMGVKSVKEVKEKLMKLGYKLKDE